MCQWRTLLTWLLVCWLALFGTGCAVNSEPIERASNRMIDEVVSPAIGKAISDLKQRSAALQGQGSLINPGYVMDGYGIAGTGFVWTARVKLDGVSANLAGATQADEQQEMAADAESEDDE